jgi:putative membrane protein
MGMLGALLTFARRPLYAPHADTTLAYGLTPLADQQLAGLVMWVPAALPYLLAAALLAGAWLERPSASAGR